MAILVQHASTHASHLSEAFQAVTSTVCLAKLVHAAKLRMFVVGCGALNAEPTQPLVDKGAGGLPLDEEVPRQGRTFQ